MKKIIIAFAALAATAGIASAEPISSRYVYGDAPAPESQMPRGNGIDYSTTASVGAPATKHIGISSRYQYGDAAYIPPTASSAPATYSMRSTSSGPVTVVSPRAPQSAN